ncbi:MAG TPA: phosphoglycerate kinase [Halanaerobiales bacterium]|nr:phosphoglycerate kinase [Halanaerobiales bacterium]
MKKSLKDFDFKGKKVLVRVDFNVPLEDGEVTDNNRIEAALPTIKFLINEDAKVILMSHLGRPKGEVKDEFKMDPVGKELANLLNKKVFKVDDCIGDEVQKAVGNMGNGDVVLLENTRFYPGEKANDPEFAKKLAANADIFVLDAFGAAHRAHASTVGVTEYLPSAAGFLLMRELNALGDVMDNPASPFVAIMGGAKISGKISVIENLLDKVDYILTGGGIANTFLKAQGYEVGESLVEDDKLETARELINKAKEKNVILLVPKDVVIADKFAKDANAKEVGVTEIPTDWQILDSGGSQTLEEYTKIIKQAKTVIWNGPIGVFEFDKFAKGTNAIAKALAETDAKTVIGGGESAAAVKKAGLIDKMTHVSTGGGASLRFFEGKPLPAVEALDELK